MNNYIPTLKGKSAEKFLKMSEENLKNKGTIDFSKEFETYKKTINKSNDEVSELMYDDSLDNAIDNNQLQY